MTDVISTKEQIHSFIDNLEVALDLYGKDIVCNRIILYGMGGSAISNDVVSDYCMGRSNIPIMVIKGSALPAWADGDTLVVTSSYSGNTLETLEAYGNAKRRKCKIIVLSSGGNLRTLAKKNGDVYIPLPPRMHPRHSIGFMIGYIISIVEAAGCKNLSDDIFRIIPNLKEYRDELESGDTVYKLAKKLIGCVPVICSYSEVGSIAFRWKTQFNENSKMVAFCTTIQKLLHSNISVLSEKTDVPFKLVILSYGEHDKPVAELVELIKSVHVGYVVVPVNGKTHTENMFRMMMLGDSVSVRIAEMEGIDSSSVPPITKLKENMKEFSDERYRLLNGSD